MEKQVQYSQTGQTSAASKTFDEPAFGANPALKDLNIPIQSTSFIVLSAGSFITVKGFYIYLLVSFGRELKDVLSAALVRPSSSTVLAICVRQKARHIMFFCIRKRQFYYCLYK